MKRLRELRGGSDPALEAAAQLASVRGSLADDPLRRQRVRAKLRRRRPTRVRTAWLRTAVMLFLVCSVAVASAMAGRVTRTIRAHIEEVRAARRHASEGKHRRHAQPAKTAVASSPATVGEPTAPVVTPPALEAAPVAAPAAPLAARATSVPAVAAPAAQRASGRTGLGLDSAEQRLLVDAVRALRHEHAPARAAQLLTRYLDGYPDGTAAEDALALALEATLGRDPPRAAAFARRYLARYPAGRWSSLAESALTP